MSEDSFPWKVLKFLVGGVGVKHPILSTVIVMILFGGAWYGLVCYYRSEQMAVPPSPSLVPVPAQVKTAVDSPCSNNSVTAGGTVSIECPPSNDEKQKGIKHDQSKKP
jgi:hypothetical protein